MCSVVLSPAGAMYGNTEHFLVLCLVSSESFWRGDLLRRPPSVFFGAIGSPGAVLASTAQAPIAVDRQNESLRASFTKKISLLELPVFPETGTRS